MAVRNSGRTARTLAIAGAASIAVAVSLITDESADWAWGAMTLMTLLALVLFAIAAAIVLKRRYRGARDR